MDPQSTWNRLCEQYAEANDGESILFDDDREEYRENWENLIAWMRKGGFSPMHNSGSLPQFHADDLAVVVFQRENSSPVIHVVRPTIAKSEVFYLR